MCHHAPAATCPQQRNSAAPTCPLRLSRSLLTCIGRSGDGGTGANACGGCASVCAAAVAVCKVGRRVCQQRVRPAALGAAARQSTTGRKRERRPRRWSNMKPGTHLRPAAALYPDAPPLQAGGPTHALATGRCLRVAEGGQSGLAGSTCAAAGAQPSAAARQQPQARQQRGRCLLARTHVRGPPVGSADRRREIGMKSRVPCCRCELGRGRAAGSHSWCAFAAL